MRTSGRGTVSVYKSNARGSLQRVDDHPRRWRRADSTSICLWRPSATAAGTGSTSRPEPRECSLSEPNGRPTAERRQTGSVTLEITTLNKTGFCLNNLRILGQHPEALEHVKEVLVVDQGTEKVAEAEGFAEVESALGGKLRIIDQDNLGGSGGFARGMYEAVENGSDYVLLLDDDIVVEPESIVRLRHLRRPLQEAHHRRRSHVRPLRPYRPAHLRRGGRTRTSSVPP